AHTVAPALLGVTRAATRLGRGGRRAPAHLVAVDDVRATWGRGQRAPVHGRVSEVCGVPAMDSPCTRARPRARLTSRRIRGCPCARGQRPPRALVDAATRNGDRPPGAAAAPR